MAEAHLQEETVTEESHKGEMEEEEEFGGDTGEQDQFAMMSEEEVIDMWNENLYLDAPTEVDDEGYDYDYEDPYNQSYYGEDRWYG